jgi:hypothetical protein
MPSLLTNRESRIFTSTVDDVTRTIPKDARLFTKFEDRIVNVAEDAIDTRYSPPRMPPS